MKIFRDADKTPDVTVNSIAPLALRLEPARRANVLGVSEPREVVSRTFASWNQLDGWLRQVEALWRAA